MQFKAMIKPSRIYVPRALPDVPRVFGGADISKVGLLLSAAFSKGILYKPFRQSGNV